MDALPKFALLFLGFIILFWILIDAIGYVPTNLVVSDWMSKLYGRPVDIREPFIASTIEQRVPSLNGDDNAVDSVLDSNILRSQRIFNDAIFSKTRELDFPQMNRLVDLILEHNKSLLTKYESQPAFKNYKVETIDDAFIKYTSSEELQSSKVVLDKVLLHLLASINKQALMAPYKITTPYHEFHPFKMLEYTIIQTSHTRNNKYIRYKMHIHMARPFKTQTFIFYVDVVTDALATDGFFMIKTMEIVGTPTEHLNNMVSEDYRKSKLDKREPSLNDVFVNYPIIGSYGKPNDDVSIFEEKKIHDEAMKSYKCFHPSGVYGELPYYYNELDCVSYHDEVKGVGVWDKPCKKDTDCPFYKANINYNNSFGGCNAETKKCEMPLGIVRIGYRQYSKKHEPMCYNCDNIPESTDPDVPNNLDRHRCCKTQVNPDYMFEGDSSIRRQFSKELEAAGLEVNPTL